MVASSLRAGQCGGRPSCRGSVPIVVSLSIDSLPCGPRAQVIPRVDDRVDVVGSRCPAREAQEDLGHLARKPS